MQLPSTRKPVADTLRFVPLIFITGAIKASTKTSGRQGHQFNLLLVSNDKQKENSCKSGQNLFLSSGMLLLFL
jgi:hypothetical protein